MAKIDWFSAAVRIAKFYDTKWECADMFGGDTGNFVVCPGCEKPIHLEDYPELEGAADKSFCTCPLCKRELIL